MLSDEAALLSEVNYSGDILSILELDSGFNGLDDRVPQAEGVCLDSSENLYIVSEPNILYLYSKD